MTYNMDLLSDNDSAVSVNVSNSCKEDCVLNSQEDSSKVFALYIVLTIIGLIIVVGCIGNVMVFIAVKSTKHLQTVSNYFVINLSISDLVFLTCVLPFNIYTFIVDGWYLEESLCQFVGFLSYTLTGTTVITIVLIAFNRYKLVVDPANYSKLYTKKNTITMIVFAWVSPAILLLPAVTQVWGKFGYVPMMMTCNLLLDHNSQRFKIFLLVVRTGLPCLLVIYYYISIYVTTHRSHQRLRMNMQNTTNMSQSLHSNMLKKEMLLTRIMCMIFIVFVVSYFPCTITGIIDWNRVMSKTFHMFCATSVYVGSALNPVLYGLLNSKFRQAYFRMLTFWRKDQEYKRVVQFVNTTQVNNKHMV